MLLLYSPGISDIFEDYETILIIAGIAFLVAGFLIYKLGIMIPGFIIGGIIGLIIGSFEGSDEALMFGLIGGAIGAVIALALEELLIFLLGAGAAILLLFLINDDPSTLAVIIVGLIGGIIALAIWKFWIIVVTSILGSILFCIGTDTLDSGLPIVLTFVGIGIQYGLKRLFPSLSEEDENTIVKNPSKISDTPFSYKRDSSSDSDPGSKEENSDQTNENKIIIPPYFESDKTDTQTSINFEYKRKKSSDEDEKDK